MTEQRPEHVRDIANAGLDGMKAAMTDDTSTAELLSAGLTIMARFVQVLVEGGVDEANLRAMITRLLFPVPMAPGSRRVH